jgi:hypothetical protein
MVTIQPEICYLKEEETSEISKYGHIFSFPHGRKLSND